MVVVAAAVVVVVALVVVPPLAVTIIEVRTSLNPSSTKQVSLPVYVTDEPPKLSPS